MNARYLTALPVYNEASHLEDVLEQVRKYSSEILIVDDGSTDETAEILSRQRDVHVVAHPRNLGYGAALRSAFGFSVAHEYDILVTIDCDGQHQPQLIPEFAARVFPQNDEPVDMVSGSRYLKSFPGDNSAPADRRRINMTITELLNRRLGLKLTDSFCGFKAYRTPVLEQLRVTELGYVMPIPIWVQVAKLGLRVEEFPVPRVYLEEERSFGGSLDNAQERMAYYLEVLDREIAAAFPLEQPPALSPNVPSQCSESS